MKKFFIYCIVIIGTLFVGLTFYMFAKNNENITMNIPEGETVYLNVGDSFDIPLVHTKKDKRTTIETKSDNADIVLVNSETNKLEAKAGGTVTVTITPSNDNFGPFHFTVRVGDGTDSNPYFISNTQQLLKIGDMDSIWTLSDSYEVVENLDFSEIWVDGNKESWTPIGNAQEHFSGKFNGGSKTISNLYIDETCTDDNVGLFGYVESGAKIERITLLNPEIKSNSKNVGIIAGYSEASISRCKVVNGSVESSNTESYVGALAGKMVRVQGEAELAMCQVDKTSVNGANIVGGLAGSVTAGVISNCKVIANIANSDTVVAKNAGGLVGEIKAKTFTQNVNTEEVFTYNTLIQTCLAGSSFGMSGESTIAQNADIMVAIDEETGDSATEFVGNIYYSSVEVLTSTKGKVLTRTELEDQSNFNYVDATNKTISWDFSGTWSLENKTGTDSIGPVIIQDGAGQMVRPLRNGSEINNSNVIEVITKLMDAGKSAETAHYLDYTYVIAEDITVDVKESFPNGWTPIGNSKYPFKGVVYAMSGKSLTLKNVTIPTENIVSYEIANSAPVKSDKTAGIFGNIGTTASVSGLNIIDLIINSDENTYVGGVAGKNSGNISGITIEGLAIKNGQFAGGIVGSNLGNISSCSVKPSDTLSEIPDGKTELVNLDTKISVSGNSNKIIGGIAGENAGTIKLCTTEVMIDVNSSSSVNVGGLVGENLTSGKIQLSAKTGGVSMAGGASVKLGGLVGKNSGNVEQCYSSYSSINASKNSSSYVGGLAGETAGTDSLIKLSYFNGTIEGYNVGGLVGYLAGPVQQCYSEASINSSVRIGGLAYRVASRIENCYFWATNQISFSESTSDNVFAGFTVEFPKDGYISKCLTSATQGVTNNGTVFPETKDFLRNQLVDFFDGTHGTLNYVAVNKTGFDISWGSEWGPKLVGWKQWGNEAWKFHTVEISGDGMMDGKTRSMLSSTLQFDTTIWNLEGTSLKLVGLDLEDQIVEEDETPSIEITLADNQGINVSMSGNDLTIANFVSAQTVVLNVAVKNTELEPVAIILTGSEYVSVGTVNEGKLSITANIAGSATVVVKTGEEAETQINITISE